jgi:hypothetical protein
MQSNELLSIEMVTMDQRPALVVAPVLLSVLACWTAAAKVLESASVQEANGQPHAAIVSLLQL